MIPQNQFGDILDAWSNEVRADRARQGLPPLTDEGGSIGFGQEVLRFELAAPRIVIIPRGIGRFRDEQPMPRSDVQSMRDAVNPRMIQGCDLRFEAHLWGDEWPGNLPKPSTWDFNAALELLRELYSAIRKTVSGPPGTQLEDAVFDQPTDQARSGRLLVIPFVMRAQLTDTPFIELPLGKHPKVETDIHTEFNGTPTGDVIVVPPT